MGVFAPGEPGQAKISLRNAGDESIVLATFTSSCKCVTLKPSRLRVEPKSTVSVDVLYDPAESPEFRGGLGVIVTGESPDGTTLFRVTVDLTVKASKRLEDRP